MRRVLFNVATFVPGVAFLPAVRRVYERRSKGTGGTSSARYCYSVWLRHLVEARNSGLNINPETIAELGPGDSLGMGLAALLSGARRYYAFDVVEHADLRRNLKIFDELVDLFRLRADIPDGIEFPDIRPTLESYRFPHDILSEGRMINALHPDRIEKIRNSLMQSNSAESLIQYRVPWLASGVIEKHSIDMVFSQAVLEHIDNLPEVYQAMQLWLAPGGYLSHQIDFKSHGFAQEWNGHWTYSDFMWTLIRGKDIWNINREPNSTHLRLLQESGLKIVSHKPVKSESSITKRQISRRFRHMPDEDLLISGAFYQAVKETGH